MHKTGFLKVFNVISFDWFGSRTVKNFQETNPMRIKRPKLSSGKCSGNKNFLKALEKHTLLSLIWIYEFEYYSKIKVLVLTIFLKFQFDLYDDDDRVAVESSNFNFVFDFDSKVWNAKTKNSTFLEINFFDVSRSKTNMIFRGNVLLRISDIPTINL